MYITDLFGGAQAVIVTFKIANTQRKPKEFCICDDYILFSDNAAPSQGGAL